MWWDMKDIKPIVSIKSDGTPFGTYVTHIETGADIPCNKVTYSIDAKGLCDATIHLSTPFVSFDVTGTKATLKGSNEFIKAIISECKTNPELKRMVKDV